MSQRIVKFENGYQASIIDHGYGSERGLKEIAVLDAAGRIVYDTPVTDDVIGHLNDEDVERVCAQIAALPERGSQEERLQRYERRIAELKDELANTEEMYRRELFAEPN